MHWRSIRPILIGVPLVLAAWLGSMMVLTLFQSAGVPVAVIARGAAAALSAVVAADPPGPRGYGDRHCRRPRIRWPALSSRRSDGDPDARRRMHVHAGRGRGRPRGVGSTEVRPHNLVPRGYFLNTPLV